MNYNNIDNIDNNKSRLPEQPGLYGIVSSTIGITEYVAFFIINKIISILGIDTSGKDLNNLLDELYKGLENPETRQKFLLVMGSLAEILVVLVDELSGPLKEATLQFIDLGQEATVKLAKTFVAASIDALGVVPVAGEIIEGIKLFDDIAKQIQSSINVFLKTFTLLTNLLGASLDSVNNIKTRIDGSVEKIKSQFQDINLPKLPSLSLDNIPSLSLDNIPNIRSLSLDNIANNITSGVSNFSNNSLKGVENKINSGLRPAQAEQAEQEQAEQEQAEQEQAEQEQAEQEQGEETNKVEETSVGGMKNINKNINKELKKITKKLNKFYNRKHKPNMTRRQRKQ